MLLRCHYCVTSVSYNVLILFTTFTTSRESSRRFEKVLLVLVLVLARKGVTSTKIPGFPASLGVGSQPKLPFDDLYGH